MKPREIKKLSIEIEGSDRKRKQFEKDLRTFIMSYKARAGVHGITVREENITIKTLIEDKKVLDK